MTEILTSVAVVAGLGLLVGIILGVVGKAFAVEEDPKEAAVRECLPGNNCGGCGYAGCDSLAAAIAKGEADPGACPVGGADVAAQISEIMGVEASSARYVAFVHCAGNRDTSAARYNYYGNLRCRELATMVGGGSKACAFGCLGHGECQEACQFDAIHVENGLARVNKELCKGCGACVKVCPKNLIELVEYGKQVHVQCASLAKGKEVMQVCKAGCIGCGICEKNCKFDAVHVVNNVAVIDYEKCKSCGLCALKCPRGVIINQRKPAAKAAAKKKEPEAAEA